MKSLFDAEVEKVKKIETSKIPDWRVILLVAAVLYGHVITVYRHEDNVLVTVIATIVAMVCYWVLGDIAALLRRGEAMQETIEGVLKFMTGREQAGKPSVTTKASTVTPPKFPFPKAGGSGTITESFPE
jgi:hypothetical protein